MTFTFEVDTIPARASIDQKMLLIDRIYKDNSKTISENQYENAVKIVIQENDIFLFCSYSKNLMSEVP